MLTVATETGLTNELLKLMRRELRGFVIFKHADKFRHGVPDISVTSHVTSWLEVKHADPGFDSKGIQELTMLRLANMGPAFYIIYAEPRGSYYPRQTMMILPTDIGRWEELRSDPLVLTQGFDHKWVVEKIRMLHKQLTIDQSRLPERVPDRWRG
jgi:hypothetical protein